MELTDPAGPIVVWFFGGPPPDFGDAILEPINGSLARGFLMTDGDLSSGTIADLIAAIQEGRATIVVHTQASPPGELRGTLQ